MYNWLSMSKHAYKKRKTKHSHDHHDHNHSDIHYEIWYEIYGITLITISLITLANYGAIGRNLSFISRIILGTYDFVLPLGGICLALYIMIRQEWPNRWSSKLTGWAILAAVLFTFNHFFAFYNTPGSVLDNTWALLFSERETGEIYEVGSGMLGAVLYAILNFLFDDTGTIIILISSTLAGLLLVTSSSYSSLLDSLAKFGGARGLRLKRWLEFYKASPANKSGDKHEKYEPNYDILETEKAVTRSHIYDNADDFQRTIIPDPVIHDFEDRAYSSDKENSKQLNLTFESAPDATSELTSNEEASKIDPIGFEPDPNITNYRLPDTSLLNLQSKRKSGKNDIAIKSKILMRTLSSFGVQAKVTDIHRGPAVTRYELQPETGVKVSRIVNLSDDIALALAAQDIRIEAPIPGKSALGIEVPNSEVAMVGLRELIEDSTFQEASTKLSISLGRAISGEPVVADLSKMPHLLVAGSTGSGKSVCINSIIISLLYKACPHEVKLIMIDPKMVELSMYNGIPHLLVPVVTDPKKASIALKKVVAEMEKRYELFANSSVRDIERYNQVAAGDPTKQPLPYIVVIVDELADLMMVAASDVEDAICRLAQMARAAGIHLIIATQRPSVDIITGVIKANIPSRIAFAVSSQADSRTILDMGGADKLLGRGDMLYMPIGAAKPVRVQGSYVTDAEVTRIIEAVCDQQKANYFEEMIPTNQDIKMSDGDIDALYDQAVRLVLESQTASASFLQRKLRIGYARAARLIDTMEEQAIIGQYEGSKPRDILVTLDQYDDYRQSG